MDITAEVWTVATTANHEDDPAPFIGRVERPNPNQDPTCEMVAELIECEGSRARADMMARAPTLWRLLAEVHRVVDLPPDLKQVIEINLYRAAPEKWPKPEIGPRPPAKTAWEKLLGDDAILP